jgi:hypothetical protein
LGDVDENKFKFDTLLRMYKYLKPVLLGFSKLKADGGNSFTELFLNKQKSSIRKKRVKVDASTV